MAIGALTTSAAVFAQNASLASTKSPEQPYFEFQVEKPVSPKPGNPHPRLPSDARARASGGIVTAQFVVDTTGKVDMSTFQIVSASNDAFTPAVREVLPTMRYYPAEIAGKKVPQLVEQPFRFAATQ